MTQLNGTWELVSSENFEAYVTSIGVTGENLEKALKLLPKTGKAGLAEKFEVDATSIRRWIYFEGNLLKESPTIPLNKEVEGPALDDRIIKLTVTTEGTNRVIRREVGPGYTATITLEVHGNELTSTLTSGTGITSVRKYKKV